MSTWIDLINTELSISTGDDKVYVPDYLTASVNRHMQYNIAKFEFPNIDGSLVKRGTPQGTQYNIEIIFQGEDHLDMAAKFKKSADNPKPWTVSHPFYGSLFVQPIYLTQDNSRLNMSVFTGQIIETLLETGIAPQLNTPDAVKAQVAAINTSFAESFAADVPEPSPAVMDRLTTNINGTYTLVSGKLNGNQDNEDKFTDLYRKASGVLNTTLYSSLDIIEQAAALYGAPAAFLDTVVNRYSMLRLQLELFGQAVAGILGLYNRPTRSLKKLYEHNAAVCITAMCDAAVTNITTDYDYRPAVLSVVAQLIGAYNTYVTNLYTLQSANGGQVDSYIPDAGSVTALAQTVSTVTAYLFGLSASAKQQRMMVVQNDTNVILVAFELYPDMDVDESVNLVIANNNIGDNELLMLRKDREIIYYV